MSNIDANAASSRWLTLTSRQVFGATIVVCTLIVLWLRTGIPAYVIASAGYDDELFVRLARSLVAGQWLGPFDNLTLVKGLGYPVFMAVAFVLGIPLKMAETMLYLAASAATAWVVARWCRSYALAAAVFVGLSFNPLLWQNELARVIREGLYVSLSLLAVLLAVVLARPVQRSHSRQILLTCSTAVVWSWFWLTREEGVWLVPSLAIAAAYSVFGWWRSHKNRDVLRPLAAPISFGLAIIGAMLLVGSVALINLATYGAFQTVEVKSAAFEGAYGALTRVKPSRFQRLVVFPKDVRSAVYNVSPAARELRPAFEGAIGEKWKAPGCAATPDVGCTEILAGWFQWALRDAVAQAGYYRDAGTAAAFYSRLDNEIDRACESGKLDCLARRASLAPPFRADYVTGALMRLPLLARVYWAEGLHVGPQNHSIDRPGQSPTRLMWIVRMADFVGSAKPTEQEARWSRVASERRGQAISKLAGLIASGYAIALLALIIVSPAGVYLMTFKEQRPGDEPLIVFAAACWIGVVVRAALLVYLDVTSIPSINILYASPASPLLVLAAIISAGGLGRLLRNRASACTIN